MRRLPSSPSFPPIILIPPRAQCIRALTLSIIGVRRHRPAVTPIAIPILTPAKWSARMSALIRLGAIQKSVLVVVLVAAVFGSAV